MYSFWHWRKAASGNRHGRMIFPEFMAFLALMMAAPASAQPVLAYALPERSMIAPEARQGVASDGQHVFAVDNSNIGKYVIRNGRQIAHFDGDPANFPHLNSCTLARQELVCASSNYPAPVHRGTVEFFDPATLAHLRSVALPQNPGSLTVLDRRGEHWWAVFAHYDGKGGTKERDHHDTLLARLDENFAVQQQWTLPTSILARLAPRSISGASWNENGFLYVSGHDKPEIYVLALPEQGSVMHHVATIPVAFFGQAIDFDPGDPTLLWSIDRGSRTLFASRMPPLDGNVR